jgi:hypothetical protein
MNCYQNKAILLLSPCCDTLHEISTLTGYTYRLTCTHTIHLNIALCTVVMLGYYQKYRKLRNSLDSFVSIQLGHKLDSLVSMSDRRRTFFNFAICLDHLLNVGVLSPQIK